MKQPPQPLSASARSARSVLGRPTARRAFQLAGLCAVLALAACGSDSEDTGAAAPADPEMTMTSGDAACGVWWLWW